MSKKCCGMIYADEDTICKICGKPLMEEVNPEQEETERNTESDADTALTETEAEEKVEEVSAAAWYSAEENETEGSVGQPEKAPGGMKTAGILTVIAAALGMTAVVLGIIFFVLFPEYGKRGNADIQMNFPEIATETDAIAQRPVLTPTDVEINESFDAGATATETDAQASETDVEEAE